MKINKPFIIAIMAAGKGTRMKSDKAKVLHQLAGRTMLMHVLQTAFAVNPDQIYVIVGHQADSVIQSVMESQENIPREKLQWVEQKEQLGTGHAIMQLKPYLQHYEGDILILNGDVPLLTIQTVEQLKQAHQQTDCAGTLLTTFLDEPTGYGRILRENGHFVSIVEQKDATEAQRDIQEVNPGIYLFFWPLLSEVLARLSNQNAQGEYYLTDAVHHLVSDHHTIHSVLSNDPIEVSGVNSRQHLAELESMMRMRINTGWMEAGVTLQDPATTYIDCNVTLAPDTTIRPGTLLTGWTQIGSHSIIGPFTQLKDTRVGENCQIAFSVVESSEIKDHVSIGPYAHIRPDSLLESHTKVGNFVELKKSHLGSHSKASHLSYLGDSQIGESCNIGAGTITCNYDGKHKHPITIGNRVFTGSNSTLVAPIALADDSYIAAGSTITADLPPGALGIGRCQQLNKEGWVYQRREKQDHD